MTESIRVVVIDDHLVTRKGIISLIEQNENIEVVAEGTAGNDVLKLLDEFRPDVLITDLQMPADEDDPKGELFTPVSTLRIAMTSYPDTAILVLTQEDDIQTIQSLAEIDVRGYMLKTDDFSAELDVAVKMIYVGGNYFSPEVRTAIFTSPKIQQNIELTERQFEVVQEIFRSPELSRKQVAEKLHISNSTLQKHITAVFEALEVTNIVSCLIKLMRMGYMDLDGNLHRERQA